jgi:hypothetical protein
VRGDRQEHKLVCSQCGRVSNGEGGWHAEQSESHEVLYCRECWQEEFGGRKDAAKVDWRGNARTRRELLRPLKDERVVVISGTSREQDWLYARQFTLRVGSISFLDWGETWAHTGEPGDLFGAAWVYRCPLRRWPLFVTELWDLISPSADLRIPRALNPGAIHEQLQNIVQTTSPSSNPEGFTSNLL